MERFRFFLAANIVAAPKLQTTSAVQLERQIAYSIQHRQLVQEYLAKRPNYQYQVGVILQLHAT